MGGLTGNGERWDSRTRRLLGDEIVERLARKRVLVLGLGGVGGYVAEFLARAGVGRLTLVDGDRVDVSNLNRQLPALYSTLGEFKAEVMAGRCREINPEGIFTAVNRFISVDEVDGLLAAEDFDAAADAIDTVPVKIAFILACRSRKLPLVSAMGAGNKLDPEMVRTTDISGSSGCPLARAVRRGLRDAGVTRGVRVVFSPEVIRTGSGFGTLSYMTAAFGAHCAAELLRQLRS